MSGVNGSAPRFRVDFNELVEPDLILLSQTDLREASDGQVVALTEGMHIGVFEENFYDDGEHELLTAEGVVVRNQSAGWDKHVKWCCRIDANGISHSSSADA